MKETQRPAALGHGYLISLRAQSGSGGRDAVEVGLFLVVLSSGSVLRTHFWRCRGPFPVPDVDMGLAGQGANTSPRLELPSATVASTDQ